MDARERLLNAAIEMASRSGAGFSMNELAASLSMSKKTIYQLFDSKEQMLVEAVDYGFGRVKKSEEKVLAEHGLTLPERLKRLIVVLPEEFAKVNWYQIAAVGEKFPAVSARVKMHLENGWEPTIALIEQGVKTGELRPISIPVFKSVVVGAIEYFLSGNEDALGGIPYEQALEEMIELLMLGAVKRDGQTSQGENGGESA